MATLGRSSEGFTVTGIGPMIECMLVGVLMFAIVALASSTSDTPTSAGGGTAEVLVVDEPWRPLAPVIAAVDHGGTIEA